MYFLKLDKKLFKKVVNENEQKFQLFKNLTDEILRSKNQLDEAEQDLYIEWILNDFDYSNNNLILEHIFNAILSAKLDYFTLKFLRKFFAAKKVLKKLFF